MLTGLFTGLTIWLLLSGAFLFGFLFRGWIHARDVAELDARRDAEAEEIARLNRMVR